MKKLLPFLFVLVFGCKKTDTASSLQISDMPLKGGNSWKYAVTNFPATEADTAVFQIAGPYAINGGPVTYTTKTSIRGVVVDSGIISLATSSLTYTGNNGLQTFAGSGLFDGWVLNFPMSSQSSWTATGATIKVISSGQILSLGGNTYLNVYTLCRTSVTPGGMVNDTLSIAPQVGIVQWHGFPLVSYHLQ